MKTLREDLRAPLDKVDRWWIRRPTVIILTLIILPVGALVGAYELTYEWYKDCW